VTRPKGLVLTGSVGLVTFFLILAWVLPGGVELWVVRVKGDEPLLVLPMEEGERFTIHYYHSVEESPIWEEHSLDKKGTIYVEEERYLKFGAGMGHMPGVGRMVKRGPYEVIEEMHMPIGQFILRVGSKGVDHTVIWRGVRVNLSKIAEHEALRFYGRPVSLLYALWRKAYPHPATPRVSGDQDGQRSFYNHGDCS